MSRVSHIIIIGTIVLALVTASFWLPILGLGSMILVSKALGGHCNGSPIYLKLKNEDCGRIDESLITFENANDPIGNPLECPLIYAVDYNNVIIFKELANKGANPTLCKGFPDEFFKRAINCHNDPRATVEIFEEFKRLGIHSTNLNHLLISQAKLKCVPGIELAVSQGADVNAEDNEGYLALHYTTQFADEESILASAALVRLGADPLRHSSKNNSPFLIAQEHLRTVGNWARLESVLLDSTSK